MKKVIFYINGSYKRDVGNGVFELHSYRIPQSSDKAYYDTYSLAEHALMELPADASIKDRELSIEKVWIDVA